MQPTAQQRKDQYTPLMDILPKNLNTRVVYDDAVNACESQQNLVDNIYKRVLVLKGKNIPYGGITDDELIELGLLNKQYATEQAKLPALQALVSQLHNQFDSEWQQISALTYALLQNPGAVEKV